MCSQRLANLRFVRNRNLNVGTLFELRVVIFDRLEHGDVASRVVLDFAEPNLRQAAIRKKKEAVVIQ
jgi:hypothetical protein